MIIIAIDAKTKEHVHMNEPDIFLYDSLDRKLPIWSYSSKEKWGEHKVNVFRSKDQVVWWYIKTKVWVVLNKSKTDANDETYIGSFLSMPSSAYTTNVAVCEKRKRKNDDFEITPEIANIVQPVLKTPRACKKRNKENGETKQSKLPSLPSEGSSSADADRMLLTLPSVTDQQAAKNEEKDEIEAFKYLIKQAYTSYYACKLKRSSSRE